MDSELSGASTAYKKLQARDELTNKHDVSPSLHQLPHAQQVPSIYAMAASQQMLPIQYPSHNEVLDGYILNLHRNLSFVTGEARCAGELRSALHRAETQLHYMSGHIQQHFVG